MSEPVAVEFEAELKQVKSMSDHTYNVVLNVPEYCLPQVKLMMGWILCQSRVIIEKQSASDALQTGSIRKSERATP